MTLKCVMTVVLRYFTKLGSLGPIIGLRQSGWS